jgi:hypothetical protein
MQAIRARGGGGVPCCWYSTGVTTLEMPRRPALARPLADLPLDGLLEREPELARMWAVALVLGREPERIGDVPLDEVALDGPRLCGQVLRALQSDAELDRLTGGGPATGRERSAPARRLAAIAGAEDAAATVTAAEALRRVLWDALASELRDAPARQLGEAADRLAHVCAAAAAAAVAASSSDVDAAEQIDARAQGARPQAQRKPASAAAPAVEPGAAPARAAVIVDDPSGQAARPERTAGPPELATSRIEIRDVRGEGGASTWIWAIGRQLDRFAVDGEPFSVLLIELMDQQRLREEEAEGEPERLGEAIEELLLEALREPVAPTGRAAGRDQPAGQADAGWLTCERPGRYWLVAAGRDRTAGQELADQIVHAAASMRTTAGQAISLAVGAASCPQDGRDASALAAHADVGLYAARAAFRAAGGPPPVAQSQP